MRPSFNGRISGCQPEGVSSILTGRTSYNFKYARIAQLVEHPLGKGEVADSNSAMGTSLMRRSFSGKIRVRHTWGKGAFPFTAPVIPDKHIW